MMPNATAAHMTGRKIENGATKAAAIKVTPDHCTGTSIQRSRMCFRSSLKSRPKSAMVSRQ
jgi:hypothetical protein